MAPKELEYAEQRMKQRWYDLVMAEERGAVEAVLERLYTAYILAVEEYNRCSSGQHQEQPRKKKAS